MDKYAIFTKSPETNRFLDLLIKLETACDRSGRFEQTHDCREAKNKKRADRLREQAFKLNYEVCKAYYDRKFSTEIEN